MHNLSIDNLQLANPKPCFTPRKTTMRELRISVPLLNIKRGHYISEIFSIREQKTGIIIIEMNK